MRNQPIKFLKASGRGKGSRRRGFSIIELLVAIIIIGILVSVLIPVVSSRTRDARIARVNADLENLSESMERVAIDTSYYVRLFALNDTLRGDGMTLEDTNDRYEGLTDYATANPSAFYDFPDSNSLFIDPESGDFATLNRINFIDRLVRSETSYDGSAQWGGPYINWQKDTNNFPSAGYPNLEKDGIPDDPWGNNYLFFTRMGLVLEPDGIIATSVSQSTIGEFSNGGTWDCEVFGRATIMSLGPDGQPGTGQASSEFGEPGSDDFVREFGR